MQIRALGGHSYSLAESSSTSHQDLQMALAGNRTSLKKPGTCKVEDLKFEVSTKSLCCSLFWERHLLHPHPLPFLPPATPILRQTKMGDMLGIPGMCLVAPQI